MHFLKMNMQQKTKNKKKNKVFAPEDTRIPNHLYCFRAYVLTFAFHIQFPKRELEYQSSST